MQEEKYNEKIYAKIDRQFLQNGNDWFMEPKELYIFTALALCERKDGVARVSYQMIDSLLPEKFNRTRTENNKLIADIIKKLVNRNFIKASLLPNHKGYYDFFYIKILYDNWEEEKKNEGTWMGFEPIYWKEFINVEKINYFYIYCITKTNQGTGQGFKCSFDMWAERTGFSISTIKRYINQMTDKNRSKKILFRRRGEFIGESKKMQEVNIYRTYEFTEDEKSNRDNNHEHKKKNEKEPQKLAFGKNNKKSNKKEHPF